MPLLLVLALLVSAPAAGASVDRSDPAAVAREYVASVSAHSPTRICRLVTPELARWLARDGRRSTCAAAVSRAYSQGYGDPRWKDARIVAIDAVETTGDLTTIRMRLDHHFVCSKRAGCRRPNRHFRSPEILHLLRHGDGWRLAKPGSLLVVVAIDSATFEELHLYPPGDQQTVTTPAAIPQRSFTCSGLRRTAVDSADDLDGEEVPVSAPWLDIRRLEVRSNASRACITLRLAAPPMPASRYGFGISWPEGADVLTGTSFELEIDARGGLHPLSVGAGALQRPTLVRFLPRFGIRGRALTFEIARRHLGPGFRRPWLVSASARSLQRFEPLLSDPLDAEDVAPGRPMAGGCLRYPRGGVALGEVC